MENYKMRHLPTIGVALGLAVVIPSLPAGATVSIALQESGVNGGAATVVATAPDFASTGISYGTFQLNYVSVSDLTAALDSAALNVSSAAPGDLTVYVTTTDQAPLGPTRFRTGLTANLSPPGWTETLETYLDTANVAFAQTVLLGANTFTDIGTDVDFTDAEVDAPYSVTGIYRIFSNGVGTSLLSEQADAKPIPEPCSLMILGAGLLGTVTLIRRRRESQGRPA
jgi:hypothetical protein